MNLKFHALRCKLPARLEEVVDVDGGWVKGIASPAPGCILSRLLVLFVFAFVALALGLSSSLPNQGQGQGQSQREAPLWYCTIQGW